MGSSSWMLAFASIFTVISLAMIAISFSTDHWIDVIVTRSSISGDKAAPWYFTRSRGLFRTCYEGNETTFLDDNDHVVDGNCLTELGYEIDRREETIGFGDNYEARIHLMRSHFGFMILAMLFLVIGCVVAIAGCWKLKPFVLQMGGLVVFVGAFFGAGAMAFFHGYDYLEREKINEAGFQKYIKFNLPLLNDNSKFSYGYSYILGWIGVGCAAIGAVLFLLAAMSISNQQKEAERVEKKRERKYKEAVIDSMYGGYPNTAGYGGNNAGYGGGYNAGYSGYSPYSGGPDPYAMSMYNTAGYNMPSSNVPAIGY